MNKTIPYLLAAIAYFSPRSTSADMIGPDGVHSIDWIPPTDVVEFRTQRVVRHISYRNPAVYNSNCPLELVPAMEYSLVSRKGDTLDGILKEFRTAGVSSLSMASEKWKEYTKKAIPENLVFKLGEAGPCSR